MATLIERVESLRGKASLLKALGYRYAEDVLGAASGAPQELRQYLAIDATAFDALLDNVRAALPAPAPMAAAIQATRRLGTRLGLVPRRETVAMAFAPKVAATLPSRVDLIAQMQPIRDQGNRGTSVAHAVCAVVEHYWFQRGKRVDLSEQFAYWNCKRNDDHPSEEGTWIGVAMPLLKSDGCAAEADWPYVSNDIDGNEGQGPAPEAALAGAGQFRISDYREIAPTAVDDLRAELAEGRPVAFSIPVFNSWFHGNPQVDGSGDISNPIPGEQAVGGHAMCMVGYEDEPEDPGAGGGRFLIRNSWDSHWGTQSSTGHVRYGTIPYSYIARFGVEAFSAS